MQACLQKQGITVGGAQPGGQQNGQNGRQGGLGGGQNQPQGGFRAGGDRGAFAKCLPARLQRFRATITTPEQTLQQVVNPPQTNIKSSSYTIAGVDPATPDVGVVTPALVTRGRFIAAGKGAGKHEALVSSTYANRQGLKVGSKLNLNGTVFTVVGLVRPPLGGQTADVYVALPQLQVLASQKGSVNVLLVRAENGASVGDVQAADRERSIRGPRSRARRTSPTRSAGRSSTPRASPSGSARRSRSWPPRPPSCSRSSSPCPRSASACGSSGR